MDRPAADPSFLERRLVCLGIVACKRDHGEPLAAPLGKALQAPDEDIVLGRRHVGRPAVDDGDRLKVGAVLEENAAIPRAEGVPGIRCDGETELRQPRARKRQRGDGKDEVVDSAHRPPLGDWGGHDQPPNRAPNPLGSVSV